MNKETWTAVDQYFTDLLVPSDPALEAALKDSAAAGLPSIHVSANQGKLLHILAKLIGAKNILEIGTLGGYSTIWLARALPKDGRLITLEAVEKHAQVAQANLTRAGLTDRVEIILGRAMDTLPRLAAQGRGPFDLIFIDADKPPTANYFEWAMKLSRPGTLIVVDNVVRSGGIIDAASGDSAIQGVRRFLETLSTEKRATATAFQTVGSKGYDGMAIIRVDQSC